MRSAHERGGMPQRAGGTRRAPSVRRVPRTRIRARARAVPWAVVCWVFVLVAIGSVQVVRSLPFDAAVFFAAAAAVAFEPLVRRLRALQHRALRYYSPLGHRALRHWPLRRRPLRHRAFARRIPLGRIPLGRAVPAALAACLAAATLPRHGAGMRILVILVGVAAVAAGLGGPAARETRRDAAPSPGIRRLGAAWSLVLIAGCLWELFQFLMSLAQPHGAWYSLSDLLNPFVAHWEGKTVFAAAWLACGVWLLRRGARPARQAGSGVHGCE